MRVLVTWCGDKVGWCAHHLVVFTTSHAAAQLQLRHRGASPQADDNRQLCMHHLNTHTGCCGWRHYTSALGQHSIIYHTFKPACCAGCCTTQGGVEGKGKGALTS